MALRRILLAAAALLLAALAYALFGRYTASESFVRADREAIIVAARQPAAAARQTCAGMSRFSHVDGLTDGNFMLPGFLGTSYFYRSMCFQTLAISSGDASLCAQARPRHTLLGRDAGVSEQSCRAQVAKAAALRRENDQRAAQRAQELTGLAKIATTSVQRTGPNSWLVSVQAQGALAGEYEFALTVARRKFSESETLGLLYREVDYLAAGDNRRYWTVTREQLFRALDPDTKPGGVYSIAVSMTYLKPARGASAAERVGAGIGNAYIDDR